MDIKNKKNLQMYELEDYYIQRWQTTSETLRLFDWKVYQCNYEKAPPSKQSFIIKMMMGWLPVYHHLNKMDSAQHTCPHC